MDYIHSIHKSLLEEGRRRLMAESVPRITQCLNALNNEQIWYRPNENSNSIGNLVLHLCGNVRQYILTGIDGQKDIRQRHLEFSERGPIPKEDLIERMNALMIEVDQAFSRINPNSWVDKRKVQGFDETVISIFIHVIEHFSYHTGQIAYYTKQVKDMDLKFYGDLDLDITS